MSEFRKTCQKCFQQDGLTIPLVKGEEGWECPRNPDHKIPENDIIVC